MDTINLIGAEDVRAAANTMRSAAELMERAASNINYSLEVHQRHMDDWLQRFTAVVQGQLQAALIKEEEVKEISTAHGQFGVGA